MIKCALSACSDFDHARRPYAGVLIRTLEELGIQVSRTSTVITSHTRPSPEEKAAELNAFYEDHDLSRIYDMSGGNSAHELLPYLDYDAISRSQTVYYGYSDLTVILNAVYAKTGKKGVLWSVMNLLRSASGQQRKCFDTPDMYRFRTRFLQGFHMEGILVGGNVRCLLKLENTAYFPDLHDKLLLLEARSGDEEQIGTYFARLHRLGAFEQIKGVILGTFTALEKQGGDPWKLLKDYIPDNLPAVKTDEIGHGGNSKAVWIGACYQLDASMERSEAPGNE